MVYESRLKKLKKEIDWKKYSAVLICSNPTVIYLTGYSNFTPEERDAYLILTPKNSFLITDSRYTQAVRKQVSHFIVLERTIEKKLITIIKEIVEDEKLTTLGIEESHLTVAEYKFFKKGFKKLPNFTASQTRSIKDKDETNAIEKACRIADKALESTIKLLKENQAETELDSLFQEALRAQNAVVSFPTIIGYGPNSAVPHHQTGSDVLTKKEGQFVLVDCGAKLENYCSDMTRTFFYGNPSEKQIKIYETVLIAQQKAAEFLDRKIKQGKKVKGFEVDKIAREYIKAQGFEPYNHGLGHGIGLEVHEAPNVGISGKNYLEEGMVFSIEPGIYIPDYGGVRIEDLYVIEKDGLRQLTKFPKELTIL
jgi:Xaa-Pro aminopeptidase/Xaa-Pro dipeptidase